jgi:hypothetical protein
MPVNTDLTSQVWGRYAYLRDNGHHDFVLKADICEAFFRGDQWADEDLAVLRAQRRPALTINKIISTVSNMMGEQIYNRSEISFRPRGDANAKTANTLAKVWKYVSDRNQLDWKRSDMFADGIITSRGFLDARIEYNDSMEGDVCITKLNMKNVGIDPDADDFDPDTWSDVHISKWLTADDIAVAYNVEDADLLRNRAASSYMYGIDALEYERDRFGQRRLPLFADNVDMSAALRNVRVIERQHRQLDKQLHFVEKETGDMRAVPLDFDRNRIAWFTEKFGFGVTKKLVRRIRWTVIADNVRLHDDWSPYEHFTVVPFFPHFRYGKTIGMVENLLGPQELLNKVSSQELHVVNTTANSGWKVKTGALATMSPEDLEARGAQTGLVIEINNGSNMEDVEKITPNQVPQGLDRVSYKAEEHIKTISGVSDSMQGQDREDVAAKAIQAKKQSGSTNLAKPMDSLNRSDFILARNVLSLVQGFYTEPRILTITKDAVTGETENVGINQVNPAGEIVNDLTLGEYGIIISSVPHRETLEDSQFDQAVAMRNLGVKIDDSVIIGASRLQNKAEILKKMADVANSAEAQLQQRAAQAEVAKTEAETAQKQADAKLKDAKAQKEGVLTQKEAATPPEQPQAPDRGLETAVAAHSAGMAEQTLDHTRQIDFANLAQKRQADDAKLQLQAHNDAEKRLDDRAKAAQQVAAAAVKPKKPATT